MSAADHRGCVDVLWPASGRRWGRAAGRTLRELSLRALRLQVLVVEAEQVHAIPDPDFAFAAGQHVVLFGELSKVSEAFVPPEGEGETPTAASIGPSMGEE